MPQGTVQWYSEGRGRGIIIPDGGAGIGVVYSDIASDGFGMLFEGQRVAFDVARGKKGLTAKNVVPCDDEKMLPS